MGLVICTNAHCGLLACMAMCHMFSYVLDSPQSLRHIAGTNICLLTAPIIFSVLLLIIQTLINNLFLTGPKFECGCQCSQCCYGGDASNCTKLLSGYCNTDNGFSCLSTNSSACGPQFSSGQQAAFCSIPSPSNWPAIINVSLCAWMDGWMEGVWMDGFFKQLGLGLFALPCNLPFAL